MATRRTPQGGPRRGSRRDQVQRNIRPGARGTERARTTTAAAPRPRFTNRMAILVVVRGRAGGLLRLLDAGLPRSSARTSATCAPRSPAPSATSRRWSGRSAAGRTTPTSRRQARERFGWVMPGETSYQVIDRDGKPLERGDELTDPELGGALGARPVVGQGLRHPRGGRPPREGADAGDAGSPRRRRPPPRLTSEPPSGRIDVAGRGRRRRPARSAAAVDPRRGSPLPVRQPRRGRDRAAARRRHPVPDDLLPDLPAGGLADRDPRGVGPDARDDRAARRGRGARGGVPAGRTRPTSPRGPRSARCPEIAGVSAGGMPDRVKCLHVLAGQSLAQGRGVNPLGDEVLDALGEWWKAGPCVDHRAEETR